MWCGGLDPLEESYGGVFEVLRGAHDGSVAPSLIVSAVSRTGTVRTTTELRLMPTAATGPVQLFTAASRRRLLRSACRRTPFHSPPRFG
jgi:hypothetical protein